MISVLFAGRLQPTSPTSGSDPGNMHVSITLNIINYMTRVKAGRNSPSFSVEYSISKGTAFPQL